MGLSIAVPHAGVPLARQLGDCLAPAGSLIACGWHGALFNIDDGVCVGGPCAGQALALVRPFTGRVDHHDERGPNCARSFPTRPAHSVRSTAAKSLSPTPPEVFMIEALNEADRAEALSRLTAWSYDDDRHALYRKIKLADFSAAFALMVRIAFEAEKADHHPEWSNVYSRIDIWLTTHDAGGVSVRDIAMAQAIDRLAAA